MIEDGRVFEAVVRPFVVARLQVELADLDVFRGALGVVDIGCAIRRFELELLAVRVVEAEIVGVIEAGASLCLFLRWGRDCLRRSGGVAAAFAAAAAFSETSSGKGLSSAVEGFLAGAALCERRSAAWRSAVNRWGPVF